MEEIELAKGTKNRLGDMYNIFAEELERLNDDELSGEDLERELKRAEAMAKVSEPLIEIAQVEYRAWKTALEYGVHGDTNKMPRVLEALE